jgi:Lipase maturation factor
VFAAPAGILIHRTASILTERGNSRGERVCRNPHNLQELASKFGPVHRLATGHPVCPRPLPPARLRHSRYQVLPPLRRPGVADFLRVLGCIYFGAFVSFGVQAAGLIGSEGITPFVSFLRAVRESAGGSGWLDAPTVLWVAPVDAALHACWIAGAICSLAVLWGRWRRAFLIACFVLWVSICTVGQEFLGFQWDALLAETGFLAIFADASVIRVWLFRWLAFRLMFFSGVVKLLSHDPVWRDLTAMSYHYWTQPLPTPAAWYAAQLPLAVQKATTAMVFVTELLIPVLFFAPRRIRYVAACATVALQAGIFVTGNYTFFNVLTAALTMWLFIEPEPQPEPQPEPAGRNRSHVAVTIALLAVVGGGSVLMSLQQLGIPLPPGGPTLLHSVMRFQIVNPYGLFATMTTERPEIIVEGSNDGVEWRAYEFRYKAGDLHRPPPIVAPHQPRLDWQMWFAALGSYQENRWFVNFIARLLEGRPQVLGLLAYNPFPNAPPRYIRARLYSYHFTRWGSKDWWTRDERGTYLPQVSLK